MPRKSKNVVKTEQIIPAQLEYDCLLCFQRFSGEAAFQAHQTQCQGITVGTSFSSIIKEEMKVLHNFPDSENETAANAKKSAKQIKK